MKVYRAINFVIQKLFNRWNAVSPLQNIRNFSVRAVHRYFLNNRMVKLYQQII